MSNASGRLSETYILNEVHGTGHYSAPCQESCQEYSILYVNQSVMCGKTRRTGKSKVQYSLP